ncbi:fatty acyl-AMP ligase [Microbacterium allomyrinae]|uniref:Fatty acyl-AMP ligase n=1 Tax=Microbacterium allomyrinae TaxID=2830666 RepID=A0A9X1S3U1_9MICO|nr:fatty acyl-AMP ligase [Microbacterium allomyrinae]MCC2034076.1 fatty acyl-AMP ligase [Microbacterium allomyrinae]
MRRSASRVGDDRGIRFYADEKNSVRLGYRELDERARARASELNDRGYGVGDVAVLGFEPGLGFVEAVYAVLYAGMTIAPVPVTVGRNPQSVIDRIAAITTDAGARIALTDASARPLFDAAGLSGVEVAALPEPQLGRAATWSPPEIDADSIALLQYTSGSTGTPKGVIVTHGNLVANEEAIGATIDDGPDAVWVGWLPHYHDMGLIGLLFRPVYAGVDSVLTSPSRFLRRPLLWLRLITKHKGTFTVAPDFAYRLCAQVVTDEQLAELDLSSLTHIVTGAEPIKTSTVDLFVDRFAAAGLDPAAMIPAYGMAETTLIISAASGRPVRAISADLGAIERGDLLPAADERSVDLVLCGPPVPGSTVAIVDPVTHVAVPDGRIGEIWVNGPSVTHGYWGRPEETAEAYGFHLPDTDKTFLRTGDLGAIVDGEVVVAGRLKDLIISHGRNVFPQDVESIASAVVGTDPACLSAAFALDEHQPSEVGVAVEVDPKTLATADVEALVHRVRRDVMAEFGLPSVGIALLRKGMLPRTTSGKIQRRRARAELLDGQLTLAAIDGITIAGERHEVDLTVT